MKRLNDDGREDSPRKALKRVLDDFAGMRIDAVGGGEGEGGVVAGGVVVGGVVVGGVVVGGVVPGGVVPEVVYTAGGLGEAPTVRIPLDMADTSNTSGYETRDWSTHRFTLNAAIAPWMTSPRMAALGSQSPKEEDMMEVDQEMDYVSSTSNNEMTDSTEDSDSDELQIPFSLTDMLNKAHVRKLLNGTSSLPSSKPLPEVAARALVLYKPVLPQILLIPSPSRLSAPLLSQLAILDALKEGQGKLGEMDAQGDYVL